MRGSRNGIEQLSAELEAAALRQIQREYHGANVGYFGGALCMPALRLSSTTAVLGRWLSKERCIELSNRLLTDHGWGVVVEVLKHEMAHQYVEEVLGVVDETGHGRSFRKVCVERGIDGRATGAPQAKEGSMPILDKISKLLALAESPNEYEAQSAMNAAKRLMLKYNLDSLSHGDVRRYTFRQLGRATGRLSEAELVLSRILREHFFVRTIWVTVWRPLEGKRGKILEVTGDLENLEMASYVYAFLMQTAERLWIEHKRAQGMKKNAGRRGYLAGVMEGFRAKLEDQSAADGEQGLVWVGDPELQDYFHRRFPSVRKFRRQTTHGTKAHQQGRLAGGAITLHRAVRSGASSGTLKFLNVGPDQN